MQQKIRLIERKNKYANISIHNHSQSLGDITRSNYPLPYSSLVIPKSRGSLLPKPDQSSLIRPLAYRQSNYVADLPHSHLNLQH